MKKNVFLILCWFFFQTLPAQSICLPEQGGQPAGDKPPGCFMCGSVYQGSTADYTLDPRNIEFPCGTLENSQWISLYPGSAGEINLTISANNCQDNRGIQAVIFDSDYNAVSNCFSPGGAFTIGNLIASNLNPLESYLLVVDGFNGDDCHFRLESVFNPENTTLDTILCPGSCFAFEDSCYYETSNIALLPPCPKDIRLNIIHADTGKFNITYFRDTFTNSVTFDWSVLGADSFDIFINDVFIKTQSFSSFLLPLKSGFYTPFRFRVVPRSILGCPFKTAEEEFQFVSTSGISEQKQLEKLIAIAPNPSENIFKIITEIELSEITVYALNGSIIMTSKSNTLDLSGFKNGVYFLKIQTTFGVVLKRILKN